MAPRLYIFDLDGTLVDSAADIWAATRRVIAELAPDAPAIDEKDDTRLRPLIGRPLTEIFSALAPGVAVEPLVIRYREIYSAICADTTRPYPGVVETLQKLAGALRAIATTKRSWMARLVVEKLGLASHFDLVQGTDDFPYKPDPAILHHILAHFEVAPHDALMVGDTAGDILCARAAGVPCAAALYGSSDPDALRALGPRYALARFSDLLRI